MAALMAWRRWSLGTPVQHQHFPVNSVLFHARCKNTSQSKYQPQRPQLSSEQALAESVLEVNMEEIRDHHQRHYPQVFPACGGVKKFSTPTMPISSLIHLGVQLQIWCLFFWFTELVFLSIFLEILSLPFSITKNITHIYTLIWSQWKIVSKICTNGQKHSQPLHKMFSMSGDFP